MAGKSSIPLLAAIGAAALFFGKKKSKATASSSPSGPACPSGAQSEIASNHGHSLSVPQKDILAGSQKSYEIKGSSGHSHTVTLTPADFSALARGMKIEKMSSQTHEHEHKVFIACSS